MKKSIFFFCLFTFLLILFQRQIFALSEFKSEYYTEYRINSRGGAVVKQTISLTNNFSNIYPKEYHIEIKTPVQSITAWDEKGDILASVNQKNDDTEIRISFNEQVIGKGKTLTFYVEYQLLNFATKKGRVWEIVVPQISNFDMIDDYQISLYVPAIFGHLSYSSTQPASSQTLSGQTKYSFNKHQISSSGVVLAFGDFQIFDFTLNYYLKNGSSDVVIYEIPLPPETNYQEVFYSQLTPKPIDINIDDNGNWMAVYELSQMEEIKITAQGQAKIVSTPRTNHPYNQNQDLEKFLQSNRYWQSQNPEIVALASRLKDPKKIYNYVVDQLNYNYGDLASGNIERKGAVKAILEPNQSVCSEFTDLFVAICRAAGIPAREIEGYAYTNNPKIKPLSLKRDVLHAWPEYWDEQKKTWIQVDPTWEKTTGGIDYFNHLDLNHFTFVIHGTDSQYPPPPGSYQDNNSGNKTVNVSFATGPIIQSKDLEKDLLTVSLTESSSSLLIDQKDQTVIVTNKSMATLKNVKVNYLGSSLSFFNYSFQPPDIFTKNPHESFLTEFPIIPPFGKEIFSIPKSSPLLEWFFNPTYKLTVSRQGADDQTVMVCGNINSNSNTLIISILKIILALIIFSLFGIGIFRLAKVAKKKLF